MRNVIESKLAWVLFFGAASSAPACGGHINLGDDHSPGTAGTSYGGGTAGTSYDTAGTSYDTAGTSYGGGTAGTGYGTAGTSYGGGTAGTGYGTAGTSYGGGTAGTSYGTAGTAGQPVPDLERCETTNDVGTWIAFDRQVGNDRHLYLIHPDGSGLTRVTSGHAIDQEPAFSPDGAWISFTSDRDGSPQIYLLELATGAVTQVTHHDGGADQSSFSHDGTLLAFHGGESAFVIRTDGNDEQLIASAPEDSGYYHPQFTLDDSGVLVDRDNEIEVFTLGSSKKRMIIRNATTTIKAPALSPSGADVAYHIVCDPGRASIWSSPFSLTSGPCEGLQITPPDELDSQHPSWGPDDRIVYARIHQMDRGQLAIVSRGRYQRPCALTELGTDDRNPVWYFSAE